MEGKQTEFMHKELVWLDVYIALVLVVFKFCGTVQLQNVEIVVSVEIVTLAIS